MKQQRQQSRPVNKTFTYDVTSTNAAFKSLRHYCTEGARSKNNSDRRPILHTLLVADLPFPFRLVEP